MRSTHELRHEITVKLEIAKKEKDYLAIINYNQEILHLLNLLPEKNDDDLRCFINCYTDMATAYFNSYQHEDAAKAYTDGLSFYSSLKFPTDMDYRSYIIDAINRCDTFFEINKHNPSDQTMQQALQSFKQGMDAFKCIQNKNEGEKQLGNIDLNPKVFYYYYERIISSPHYLRSKKFTSFNQDAVLFNNVSTDALTNMFNLLSLERSTPTQSHSMDVEALTYQPH
jgi:hypothetical protein